MPYNCFDKTSSSGSGFRTAIKQNLQLADYYHNQVLEN